jgi:hypothetical protein
VVGANKRSVQFTTKRIHPDGSGILHGEITTIEYDLIKMVKSVVN